jgi:hypothetical protein
MDTPRFDSTGAVSAVGGGALGAIAALAIRQPATVREAAWRAFAGVSLAFAFTGLVCEWVGLPPDNYHRVLAVGFGLGFGGWVLLSIAMTALDAAQEYCRKNGLLGGFDYILKMVTFIRGGGQPPAPPADSGEKK